MPAYRAAVIGCGQPGPAPRVGEGYAIAYYHAAAYQAVDDVALVAAADINPVNLDAFATKFSVPATYSDYRAMLERERPDLVSICTWPELHPDMVVTAASAGVRGILCEKPMALGLGGADRMLEACARSGTVLSICHQRRLVKPWTTARSWLEAGRIGDLIRMEAWIGGGWDLLSWGTHWVDMFFYFMGDVDARWALAHAETTRRQMRYRHPVEDRSLTMVGFDGGVTGLLHIAPEVAGPGVGPGLAGTRLVGTQGQIEALEGVPAARLISARDSVDAAANSQPDRSLDIRAGFEAAVRDLFGAIESRRESELSGARARKATEVIMAAFASGLERRLIPLPYTDPEFPLSRLAAESP